jgi:predicted Zn-dependent protease
MARGPAEVQKFADDLLKDRPHGTVEKMVTVPLMKAMLDIRAGKGREAINQLNESRPFERSHYEVSYVRGLAYLQMRSGNEAVAEFQKITDHRGTQSVSILYPLSMLGTARAYVLAGDVPKARTAYQNLLAWWKDADPEIPVLIQAKEEYAKLN